MPPLKKANFQKAKKNRIFQDVVDQIQEAILDRRLAPGDVLPPERQLRETFNISRGTLREALRVLEQKGLIEIRVGTAGGSIVRQAGMEQLTETFTLLIRSGSLSVMDVGQFRTGVEGKTAALAAQRASVQEIRTLETMLQQAEEMNSRGDAGWERFLDTDQEIHKMLAKISKNSLYILVSEMVHDNIRRYYDKFLENTPGRMAENLKDLEDMIAAVRNRQPLEAERVAEEHVHKFIVHMEEKEALLAAPIPKATVKP
jgi:DNA-binding FadR family transcriptional regulator